MKGVEELERKGRKGTEGRRKDESSEGEEKQKGKVRGIRRRETAKGGIEGV